MMFRVALVIFFFVCGCVPVSCQLVGHSFVVTDFSNSWRIKINGGNVSLSDPTLTVKAGEIIEFILYFDNERNPFGLSDSAPGHSSTSSLGLRSVPLNGWVECTAFDSDSYVFNRDLNTNSDGRTSTRNFMPCRLEWTAPTMEQLQTSGKKYYYRSAFTREAGAQINVVAELPTNSGGGSGSTNSTIKGTASTLSGITGCVVATILAATGFMLGALVL